MAGGIQNQPALADLPRPARKVAVGHLTDGSITTAKIANNAVDEAKLKDALIGDFSEVVIATGDSVLLGDVGDSGNTKRDTVQGILDLLSGFEFVSTAAIANTTSASVLGFVAGFDYIADLEAFAPEDDGEVLWMRWSDDGSTFEAGTADYQWGAIVNGTPVEDVSDAQIALSGTTGVGFDTDNTMSMEVKFFNPNATSEQTTAQWSGFVLSTDATPQSKPIIGTARFIQGTDTIQGVQFLWSGGSKFKAQGDLTIWRRQRS